uniref:CD72 protein n=1 Tax=Cairina moschata TaxID=8855 RepID=A0A8C3GN54_CAIMO
MGTGERARGGCPRRMSGCVCVCGSPCPVCPRLANVSLTSCTSPSTILSFPSAPALPFPATSTLPCLPHPFPPSGDTSLPSHPAVPRVPSHPKPSPDWQATRELRDTSLEQAAERGRFSQEARAWEQSLEQARRELAQARAELQRAWREGNSSLLELGRQEAELARVSGALAGAQRELQDVQGRLNTSESTVSLLRSCTAVDCCPSGWLLYRGKCLFVSSEKKTWDDSRAECEEKYSQLLITKSWSRWTVPVRSWGTPGAWGQSRAPGPVSFSGEMKNSNSTKQPQNDPVAPSPDLPEERGHRVLDRAAEDQLPLVRLRLAGGRGAGQRRHHGRLVLGGWLALRQVPTARPG